MFCPKCGIKVSDAARFCPKCGYNIADVRGNAIHIPGSAPHTSASPYSSPSPYMNSAPDALYERKLAQATSQGLGMNWYKFIIYVQSFLGGLVGFGTGISQVLGLQYGGRANLVYDYYPALRIADIVFGITNIFVAVLMVYARSGLKKFKANSVGVYLFLPLINAVSTILYTLLASIIISKSPFDSGFASGTTIGTIVGSVGLFIANYIYFTRRRYLFTEA